jgi:hypothetical protein
VADGSTEEQALRRINGNAMGWAFSVQDFAAGKPAGRGLEQWTRVASIRLP